MADRAVRLVGDADAMHAFGSVTYRVLVGGRWVGWVGDGRPWRGWRWGGRRWWACWRQDGDSAARWSTDLDFPTRAAALAALIAQIAQIEDEEEHVSEVQPGGLVVATDRGGDRL